MSKQYSSQRTTLVALLSFLAGSVVFSTAAQATTLLGAGNTVQVFYFNGVFASPEGEIPVGASSTDPASLATAVDYTQGAADGSLITVGAGSGTQIVITNLLSGLPFCVQNTSGNACTDVIDGFHFKFTGENILGVSVDAASAPGMLPVSGTFQNNTHLGLQLLSNNDIQVDLTGDLPLVNDQLILDLSFSTVTSETPLPAALPLFVGGLGVMGFLARRRKRKPLHS
jgi:hypothetical protein